MFFSARMLNGERIVPPLDLGRFWNLFWRSDQPVLEKTVRQVSYWDANLPCFASPSQRVRITHSQTLVFLMWATDACPAKRTQLAWLIDDKDLKSIQTAVNFPTSFLTLCRWLSQVLPAQCGLLEQLWTLRRNRPGTRSGCCTCPTRPARAEQTRSRRRPRPSQ